MLVSYRWLSQYVDLTGITPEELAEKITRAGIEVEGVEVYNKEIKNVVVGYVLEREKHPEADKLSVCKVDVGDEEPVQIVCGAKNVGAGQKVAVAKVGAVLPGNFKIKKAKLRGQESHGMICSLSELGLEGRVVAKEWSEGIFNFPQDAQVGRDALEALELDDAVLELGLTPNRADALNMLGVAYEVAAILGQEVKLPTIDKTPSSEKTSDGVSVTVEATEANPLYIAKLVRDVKIGRSPVWLESRLMKAGIRPINNVVDITNYILLEYGQPLHAFDYDKLASKQILVRFAKEGETMETLDGQERKLKTTDLVITDGEKPVALAGVMGGANTEVDDQTVNVLLESAVFDRQCVRTTSKDVGLRSESSARFEKGIDPNRTLPAVEQAAAMLAELADGTVCEGTVTVKSGEAKESVVTTTAAKMNKILGTSVTPAEMADIFTRLGFGIVQNGEEFTVTVPTRRMDITIEEDLAEEVGRLYGYDHIPMTLPVGRTTVGVLNRKQALRRKAKRALESTGLHECITYSLTSEAKAKNFALHEAEAEAVRLAMPMSEERSTLRQSLLPHLLEVVSYNRNRKMEDVLVYEIGSVFVPVAVDEQPREVTHVAGALTGVYSHHAWQGEKKLVDFYVAKGAIESMAKVLGVACEITFEKATFEGFHPGRTAAVKANEEVIGHVAQLHPEVEKSLGLKQTYVFELNFDALVALEGERVAYNTIPRFPGMTRDIALVVDESVQHADLLATIKEAGKALLKDVQLFDIYVGDKLEAGKKSMAYSLQYLDPERTLTDEEVVKAHGKVLAALEEKNGAVLR